MALHGRKRDPCPAARGADACRMSHPRPSWQLPTIDWRFNRATLRKALLAAAFVLYGAIVVGSLGRAYFVDGGLASREIELRRLEGQLADAKARTERYQSQLEAFDKDAEVRMSVIRSELGMLRPDERFIEFR